MFLSQHEIDNICQLLGQRHHASESYVGRGTQVGKWHVYEKCEVTYCDVFFIASFSFFVFDSHVRFLGNLVLNLWDCGGQDAFYESYFEMQVVSYYL